MQIFPWENKFEKILEMKFTYNILFIYLYLLDKQYKVVNLNQNHRIFAPLDLVSSYLLPQTSNSDL